MKTATPKSLPDLSGHLQSGRPVIFASGRSSTVIPWEKDLSKMLGDTLIVDLGSLPKDLEMVGDALKVSGPVTWREARAFLRSRGRDLMTFPTEDSAFLLAGIATNATGEHAFSFGPLRRQVEHLCFYNFQGERISLSGHRNIEESGLLKASPLLLEKFKNYRREQEKYQNFKNAPFPQLVHETDLMAGTEGQLGVVVEATFKTRPFLASHFLFVELPQWVSNIELHLEVFEKVQHFRSELLSCELLDAHSLSYVNDDYGLRKERDYIFFEIRADEFEKVYEQLLSQLQGIDVNSFFEMSEAKCNSLRRDIPRMINERNSRRGIVKKGTDAQVSAERFRELLVYYQSWAALGIDFVLFGHIGDAHLHFNFLPNKDQLTQVEAELAKFYRFVLSIDGSPFAEHGIGLIKQKFIRPFYPLAVLDFFKEIKASLDPQQTLFPQGFMNQRWAD